MMIGALLQATAYTRAHMVIARVVSGVGMGFINSTVPVFQAEFSPKATRGLCMSTNIYPLDCSKLTIEKMSVCSCQPSTWVSS
jgi:hypothetical protein